MDNRNENYIDKNDKIYIDKNINGNENSNEINNVNDIRNKKYDPYNSPRHIIWQKCIKQYPLGRIRQVYFNQSEAVEFISTNQKPLTNAHTNDRKTLIVESPALRCGG